eukprot:9483338-Pyramimonas_sp.AAC.3
MHTRVHTPAVDPGLRPTRRPGRRKTNAGLRPPPPTRATDPEGQGESQDGPGGPRWPRRIPRMP